MISVLVSKTWQPDRCIAWTRLALYVHGRGIERVSAHAVVCAHQDRQVKFLIAGRMIVMSPSDLHVKRPGNRVLKEFGHSCTMLPES